jgi:L-rhamnose isomerase
MGTGEQSMKSDQINASFKQAQEQYAEWGVDVHQAIEQLKKYDISLHCWQVDDVGGFERPNATLAGGGIQVTGNYPGKARTIVEARQDYDKILSLLPGSQRLNLHAIYGEFEHFVDRDAIGVEHFQGWIDWAKERDLKLDFNASCFSHPKANDGMTLSSKDQGIRDFWIEHVKRCREIGAHMGREQDDACIHNVWIPDGAKDITVDRAGYRALLADSLDKCFEPDHDEAHLKDAVECKLFGIGSEWFVVGSHEFYMGYGLTRNKLICFDMGHFHPTESVADKVSSILQFKDELLLHVSRPVRWDSDHVVLLDDPIRDMTQEIVRCGEGKKIYIALDFFDASINRVGAYVTGVRATLQGLLLALLEPRKLLLDAEEGGNYFKRMALLETCKALPFGAVWDHYCESMGVAPGGKWIDDVLQYEKDVTGKRS